jgi:hypothetical protein
MSLVVSLTNDSRHDQLLPAGHPDHGPEGVDKRVAKPTCLSIPQVPFLLQSPVRPPQPDTSEASGNLLTSEPAVWTGALIGYARVSTSGQLLDRQ